MFKDNNQYLIELIKLWNYSKWEKTKDMINYVWVAMC